MCEFFSFVMNDKGKMFYFDREQRLAFNESNPKKYYIDSHASICDFYKLNEDKVNKYEYLKELEVDSKCFDLGEEKQKIMDSFIEGLDLREFVVDSFNAYMYCVDVKDDPEVRKRITDSFDAYSYCRDVKDDPKVRKLITDSDDAYDYCRDVKDDQKVRKLITDSYSAYMYCLYVKDDPEVRRYIIDSHYAYRYCLSVKDDPEVRKLITDE